MNIGVISDTHGLLRPEALKVLHGSQHIIHAGDIGDPEILEKLRTIAPLTAIRGNIDKAPWCRKLALAKTEIAEVAGISIYLLHDLSQLDLQPEAELLQVVHAPHAARAGDLPDLMVGQHSTGRSLDRVQ